MTAGLTSFPGPTVAHSAPPCADPVILDLWHPVGVLGEAKPGVLTPTLLLGHPVCYTSSGTGEVEAWRVRSASPHGTEVDSGIERGDPLPVLCEYGYVWTSLGSPPEGLFDIPEYHETDRRNLHAATIGVHVSAPRAIENFLDMGHFPFVHTGILGVEPHTEVVEYNVRVDPDTNDIWATECFFWQPQAAAVSDQGQMSEYLYRVPHPYCVLLYKSCPVDESRMDAIGLFCQALTAEHTRASMFLSVVDHESSDSIIRRFQQTVFAQDKPILENQHPKLLPLDPRAETPIRADKVAIAYRRWLSQLGMTYGVIPAG